jgi:RNA polymerase sigma-70 factor (ECF subfamily)
MADIGEPSDERASTSTSRSLLARLRANEPMAWDRLVHLYAPLVWHWCRRMNLPGQDAADIFQEVFQAVALHIGRFRKERPEDTFRGWLRTIARNKILDYFRVEQRQPKATGGTAAKVRLAQLPETAWDEEGPEEMTLQRQLFHRALQDIQAEFEERTWGAFWRVVVDGQSAQEAARELKMTAGAVRVAKCRVLNRLRRELGDLDF